jgi:hypothetical protein
MIMCVELAVAPKRLTLGRDAYELIHTSLIEGLAVLEGQKAITSIDLDNDCSHPQGIQALCHVIAIHAVEALSRDKERFKMALKVRRRCGFDQSTYQLIGDIDGIDT